MDVELRFHIEEYADDLIRAGIPREEALRRARLQFGGIEKKKEECRDARNARISSRASSQDLQLWPANGAPKPGFTAGGDIMTLALGIGGHDFVRSASSKR